jgi:DNA-binding MarR family transcriptional regulator
MRRAPTLPLEESLGFQVRDLNRLMQRALAERIAPAGVTSGAWYFLRVLWEEDGLTARELAQRLGMQEPTAVIALRGMEQAGWITRTRSEDDRRKMHVHLTPAGRALRERLLPEARAVITEATRGLTAKERATLLALLRRARSNLQGAQPLPATRRPPS